MDKIRFKCSWVTELTSKWEARLQTQLVPPTTLTWLRTGLLTRVRRKPWLWTWLCCCSWSRTETCDPQLTPHRSDWSSPATAFSGFSFFLCQFLGLGSRSLPCSVTSPQRSNGRSREYSAVNIASYRKLCRNFIDENHSFKLVLYGNIWVHRELKFILKGSERLSLPFIYLYFSWHLIKEC